MKYAPLELFLGGLLHAFVIVVAAAVNRRRKHGEVAHVVKPPTSTGA
ncbi:hypothetical protein PWY87_17890 [Kribbella solani]|nr:hypothetical protein [Kribbella solani]MDX2973098.1 hypothetical protein [Kribbella solani]MDX3003563.1 hypothetical protein [Kribbella solani]